jgi:hypothetical protein
MIAQGFTVTLADLRTVDELEPAMLQESLALLQAHDFYQRWGSQPEKINDDGLLAYYAAIEELRKDRDA